jgi:Domain of unknown function (DUF4333)
MAVARRRIRGIAICLAAVSLTGGAGLVGCGSPGIGDVEDKLASDLPKEAQKRGNEITLKGDVKCPDKASVKKGAKFDCTVDATQKGVDVTLTIGVTMTADDKFEYRLAKAEPAAGGAATTTTN